MIKAFSASSTVRFFLLNTSLASGCGAPHPDAKEVLSKKNLTVEDAEKALIIRALKECGGNRTKAAEKIGMSRRTLHRKLHAYNLHDL